MTTEVGNKVNIESRSLDRAHFEAELAQIIAKVSLEIFLRNKRHKLRISHQNMLDTILIVNHLYIEFIFKCVHH